ncbi:MAG TPA: hypothetical protein PKB06_09755, partial [Actinotalea sp.]|nr:hypothetical protein [Actinotalea sp.]
MLTTHRWLPMAWRSRHSGSSTPKAATVRGTALSIRAKLATAVALAAVALVALTVTAAAKGGERIMAERRAATQAVVESAVGVVAWYGDQAASGAMTVPDAQRGA